VQAGERRHTTDLALQRKVQSAFMAAAAGGDIDALIKLLAPDVVAMGDGGGIGSAARRPVIGQLQVARFILGLFRLAEREGAILEPVLVNGDLGLQFEADSELAEIGVSTMSIDEDGQITGIYNMVNPEKLTRIERLKPR
jgi:RNA polymerase sigma-70 factor (ECF subfamily)